MTIPPRLCDLCNGEAKLYCESDSAYLCCSCDSNVHQANFLVARHIRRTISKEYDQGNNIIQSGPILKSYTCSSSTSSSSESYNQNKKKKKIDFNRKHISPRVTCSTSVKGISSGDVWSTPVSVSGENSSFPANLNGEGSARREDRKRSLTKVDLKVEGILVNWCKRLGVKIKSTIIPLALHALRVCLENTKFLPSRVAIACSVWWALRFSGGELVDSCQNLKRLGEVCGVPGKTIVRAESKMSRVLNLNRRSRWGDDLEEGSDEC